MVVKQPKFTRVEEPTLLCNQVPRHLRIRVDRIPITVIEPTSERCEADNLTSKTLDFEVFDVLGRFQMENGWETNA
jgi:hypothetical protein